MLPGIFYLTKLMKMIKLFIVLKRADGVRIESVRFASIWFYGREERRCSLFCLGKRGFFVKEIFCMRSKGTSLPIRP
ncbi:hypothetical protein ACH33_08210 [Aneurinibacillus sp. XH2]|nr:hypothetical protein ACH33_08210 [Aneurinibacillus sp. XH2]